MRSPAVRVALALMAITGLLGFRSDPASAWQGHGDNTDSGGPMPNERVYYSVDPSFTGSGFLMEALWKGEQSWKAMGLAQQGEFWNASQSNSWARVVRVAPPFPLCSGDAGFIACATVGCRDNYSNCHVTFERDNALPWNTTTEARSGQWNDVWAVAAHEFGHWHGCQHFNGFPATDPNVATMYDGAHVPEERTIQADDASCLRTTRPTPERNMVANGSFDYTGDHLGGEFNTGWAGRNTMRWCGGAKHGSCYLSLDNWVDATTRPGDNTLTQELWAWGWFRLRADTAHQVKAWMRPDADGATPGAISIRVWTSQTEAPLLLMDHKCSLKAGEWRECVTPPFKWLPEMSTHVLKLQIVNDAPLAGSVDIDHVRMTF